MTRFYRDRLSFGRIYWILMGLLALSLLLFALLAVLIEGCPSQVGFLKTPLRVSGLLLEAVALAALMMILLRFRFLPFVSALPVLAGGSVLSVLLTRTYQTSAAYMALGLAGLLLVYGFGIVLVRMLKGRYRIALLILAILYLLMQIPTQLPIWRQLHSLNTLNRHTVLDMLLTSLLPDLLTLAGSTAAFLFLDRVFYSRFSRAPASDIWKAASESADASEKDAD